MSGFFRVSTGALVQCNTYALNPVCIVLIIPGHSRREVPRQSGSIVNPEHNDDSSHLTYALININNKEISKLIV